MKWPPLSAWLLILAMLSPAFAVQPDEVLADATLEARARVLSKQVRCMVCQNQSIDDSDAPLARDLRLLVRERLTAGDSDQKVLDFLVDRYGEFVLLKPRFNWGTALLWLAPPGVLGGGALVLLLTARRRKRALASAETDRLNAAEKARLQQLVDPIEP